MQRSASHRVVLFAPLAVALLALAQACGGSDAVKNGNLPPTPIGGAGAVDSGAADAGDAGADAGRADAGTDGGADAGPCAGSSNRPALATALDHCFSGGTLSAGMTDLDCNATIYLSGQPACTGRLAGPLNAFTGTCGAASLPCTSTSIPGTLGCRMPDAGATCTIVLCGTTLDGGCGP